MREYQILKELFNKSQSIKEMVSFIKLLIKDYGQQQKNLF